MRIRAHLAAVLALAGATACQETPSYRLRWRIEGSERPSVAACAEAGLFQVRALVFDLSPTLESTLHDERQFACHPSAFDDEGSVGGAALAPGTYAVQLRGLDRAGQVWSEYTEPVGINALEGLDCSDGMLCPSAAPFCAQGRCYDGSTGDSCDDHDDCVAPLACGPEGECALFTGCILEVGNNRCFDGELVCECQRLTVVEEGATIELPPFVLAPPPECDDGIDNDRDGLVDASDPSCTAAIGDGTEGLPVGVTELRLDLTLLGRNTALVDCSPLRVRSVRVTYGEGDAQEVVLEDACTLERPYVALLRLPAGPAVFTVTGYDGTGPAATAVTHPKTIETEISPFGGTVQRSVDFGPDDFIEPIVSPIRVIPNYVSEVGPGAIARSSCGPVVENTVAHGSLVLDRLRVQVLNGHGNPLDPPVTYGDGTVLDGESTIACEAPLTTAPLEWGSYSIVVEGLSAAGEVCFSNVGSPALMAPSGSPLALYLPRVYGDDGQVPASCRDCELDADCGTPDELACVDGVCQQRCTAGDDPQCLSDELGDLGFVCESNVCRPGP